MLTRLSIAVACTLAIVVAGCGSSSKSSSKTTSTATTTSSQPGTITISKTAPAALPKPKEPLSGFEKRLTAAVRRAATGDCAASKAFAKTSNLVLPCNAAARNQLAGFKVTGDATYGNGVGAVVEFTDRNVAGLKLPGVPGISPTHAGNVGVYPLALSPSGSYVYVPVGPAPGFPGSYIGTPPNDWAGADVTAQKFLKSISDSDCATWFKYLYTPKGMSKQQACQQGLTQADAPLRKVLKSGPVKLSQLGGNGLIYYYWLQVGKTYGTVTVGRNQPPGPAFIALGTTQAPKP